jgi:hypothetical protein
VQGMVRVLQQRYGLVPRRDADTTAGEVAPAVVEPEQVGFSF